MAVAHVTQCPWCIEGHTRAAVRAGATPQQVMEAIRVAAEMRAGAAFAHSALALDLLDDGTARTDGDRPQPRLRPARRGRRLAGARRPGLAAREAQGGCGSTRGQDAAPTTALRRWYGHDPAKWEEFRPRYFAELDGRPDEMAALRAGGRGPVTLVYCRRRSTGPQPGPGAARLPARSRRERGGAEYASPPCFMHELDPGSGRPGRRPRRGQAKPRS